MGTWIQMSKDTLEQEDKQVIVKLLLSMAKSFNELGLPKEQFVVCSDPNERDRVQFFFTIYRSTGGRHTTSVEVSANAKRGYIQ